MNDSPFKPGARVAVNVRCSDDVRESFVEKVHKNGNFTLHGSSQQWRPSGGPSVLSARYHAFETRSGYSRGHLILWDEAADVDITAKIAATKLKNRWRDIRNKIDQLRECPNEATCDAIEAALALVKS